MKRLFGLMAVVVMGCDGAHRDHGDDGGDQPLTCGEVTCDQAPAASCVDADTLREHTPTCNEATCSYPATDVECGAAGCCDDRCCEIAVSNADATGSLMPTGLTVTPPSGTFDTDSECTATSALGSCAIVPRDGLPDACVCRMDQLTIASLEVKGSRALVILAYETVRIETKLDVSGKRNRQGPGALTVYTTSLSLDGGVGGTFGTQGGFGGAGGASPNPYGDATLIPLHGGMQGQAGGDEGGGGGGALQITAGEKIEIPGAIHAGGGGGMGGFSSWSIAGGGGGGAGGGILLEAPTIVMTGTLEANGGGGGGGGGDRGRGGAGTNASDGVPYGGESYDGSGCPLYGYVYGGDGGRGATSMVEPTSGQYRGYDSRCFGSASFVGGGGGGGGLGRIRINTISGCQCSGTVSPSASFGTLGVK